MGSVFVPRSFTEYPVLARHHALETQCFLLIESEVSAAVLSRFDG